MEIPVEIFQDINALKQKLEACSKEVSGVVTTMRRLHMKNKEIGIAWEKLQKEFAELRTNFLLLQQEQGSGNCFNLLNKSIS